MNDFEWISGDWTYTDSIGVTIESWSVRNDSVLVGSSYTVDKSNEVIFEEALRIQNRDNETSYIAVLPTKIATFKLERVSAKAFSFVDPENGYPSKISYQKTKGGMRVILEGDNKKQVIQFVKRKL